MGFPHRVLGEPSLTRYLPAVQMTRRLRWCVAVLLAITGSASAVQAQDPLRVNVLRPLAFDRLAAGMPSKAGGGVPTDTGTFEVLGPPGTPIEIWFTLPAAFDGPGGALLPLDFDPSSASYSAAQSVTDRIPLDPRLRHELRIPPSGRLLVFIAGRVTVSPDQRAGRYRASIVLFANSVP